MGEFSHTYEVGYVSHNGYELLYDVGVEGGYPNFGKFKDFPLEVRALSTGVRQHRPNILSKSFTFPEALGPVLIEGLISRNSIAHMGTQMQKVVDSFIRYSKLEELSDSEAQLAAALDRYLGGIL